MNEWWAGIIGGLVAGGVILLLKIIPLPDNYQDGEFRRHLSKEEKARLEDGETVIKRQTTFDLRRTVSGCE
jgi:hypothetical protein